MEPTSHAGTVHGSACPGCGYTYLTGPSGAPPHNSEACAAAQRAATQRAATDATIADLRRQLRRVEQERDSLATNLARLRATIAAEPARVQERRSRHQFANTWRCRYRAGVEQIKAAGVSDDLREGDAGYRPDRPMRTGYLDVMIARLVAERDALASMVGALHAASLDRRDEWIREIREAAEDQEAARWQERIAATIQRVTGVEAIDASGNESGDPLDWTDDQVAAALVRLLDDLDDLRRRLAACP